MRRLVVVGAFALLAVQAWTPPAQALFWFGVGAHAEGSATPARVRCQDLQNGDFRIFLEGAQDCQSVPIVGDGSDEQTDWTFDIRQDPSYDTFTALTAAGMRLQRAQMSLTLTPGNIGVETDMLHIAGLPWREVPEIRALPEGVTNTVQFDLLEHYTSGEILHVLASTGGRLGFVYHDDAVVSFASVALALVWV